MTNGKVDVEILAGNLATFVCLTRNNSRNTVAQWVYFLGFFFLIDFIAHGGHHVFQVSIEFYTVEFSEAELSQLTLVLAQCHYG